MKGVVEELLKLRAKCNQLGSQLRTKYSLAEGDPPVSALAMMYNFATLAAETCSYYYETWSRQNAPAPGQTVDEAKAQNGERIVTQLKMAFILSLSSLEFIAKEADLIDPSVLNLDKTKRQYLLGVMKRSCHRGLIGAVDLERWRGLTLLRNALVHNNAIADEDHDFIYPDGTRIVLRSGQMAQGSTLHFFVQLMSWAADAFGAWSGEFLDRRQP